jgi:type III pantothenate kinase
MNRQSLINLWKRFDRPKRLAISCVSANELLELVQSVVYELWLDVDILRVKSESHAFGVINAYQQPEKLGVDRWLALIAVWQKYHRPACIVDCGTAITVDLIDAEGCHQGGLISPGLTLMKKALGRGTEALRFSEPLVALISPPLSLSDNTQDAIYNGTLTAAVGLIEHVLNKQSVHLILTGGDAELIANQLEVKCTLDQDLILQGLLYVLEG